MLSKILKLVFYIPSESLSNTGVSHGNITHELKQLLYLLRKTKVINDVSKTKLTILMLILTPAIPFFTTGAEKFR